MRRQLLFQVEYFYTECLETHVEAGFTYFIQSFITAKFKDTFPGEI